MKRPSYFFSFRRNPKLFRSHFCIRSRHKGNVCLRSHFVRIQTVACFKILESRPREKYIHFSNKSWQRVTNRVIRQHSSSVAAVHFTIGV